MHRFSEMKTARFHRPPAGDGLPEVFDEAYFFLLRVERAPPNTEEVAIGRNAQGSRRALLERRPRIGRRSTRSRSAPESSRADFKSRCRCQRRRASRNPLQAPLTRPSRQRARRDPVATELPSNKRQPWRAVRLVVLR
ncbi:hypothetical protein MTO96_047938 [Rhipicephalus appendiculatus]